MRTDTTVNGGAAFYYQQDHNHNVTHLTNAAGTVIEKYKYDAFGAPTFYDGNGNGIDYSTFKNRFLFTGREYAPSALGFYEYRARAYNPVLGRFMSEDPKGFDAGDYNLFRYCHNDPLDLTDPMGLADESVNAKMVRMVNLTMHSQTVLPIGSNIPVLAVQLSNAQWVDYRAAGLSMGLMSQQGRSASNSAIPVRLTRTITREREWGPDENGTYWVYKRWEYTLLNQSKQPVGQGLQVNEEIRHDLKSAVDFKDFRSQFGSHTTDSQGRVYDDWKIGFSSLNGSVTTTQRLSTPNSTKTATLVVPLRASGGLKPGWDEPVDFQ